MNASLSAIFARRGNSSQISMPGTFVLIGENSPRISEGASHQRYLEGPGLREPKREGARLLATPGSYAYLRISHGCDHTCSFCAIPAIRGPHRSKRPDDVLDEARDAERIAREQHDVTVGARLERADAVAEAEDRRRRRRDGRDRVRARDAVGDALRGLEESGKRRQGVRFPSSPQTCLERPDKADEGEGVRSRLQIRSRPAGRVFRSRLFPGRDGARNLLRSTGQGV